MKKKTTTTKKNESTDSQLFKVLNIEAHAIGHKQIDVSAVVGKQNGNLWRMIKKNTVKFNIVCLICSALNLEIVIRNKKMNCEYIINKK